jgi:hypothetical protein
MSGNKFKYSNSIFIKNIRFRGPNAAMNVLGILFGIISPINILFSVLFQKTENVENMQLSMQ